MFQTLVTVKRWYEEYQFFRMFGIPMDSLEALETAEERIKEIEQLLLLKNEPSADEALMNLHRKMEKTIRPLRQQIST